VNRGRWKSFPPGCRSSLVGAERSPTWETPGRAGSSADKAGTAWHCQTGRVRRARSDGVREEPVAKPRTRGTGSNLVDMGRDVAHGHLTRWPTPKPAKRAGGEVMVKVCGVAIGDAAGAKLGAKLIDRFTVNTGSIPSRSRRLGSIQAGGVGTSSAEGAGCGGGPVVVRARGATRGRTS
jgi:hypothetical protein